MQYNKGLFLSLLLKRTVDRGSYYFFFLHRPVVTSSHIVVRSRNRLKRCQTGLNSALSALSLYIYPLLVNDMWARRASVLLLRMLCAALVWSEEAMQYPQFFFFFLRGCNIHSWARAKGTRPGRPKPRQTWAGQFCQRDASGFQAEEKKTEKTRRKPNRKRPTVSSVPPIAGEAIQHEKRRRPGCLARRVVAHACNSSQQRRAKELVSDEAHGPNSIGSWAWVVSLSPCTKLDLWPKELARREACDRPDQ